MTHLDPDPLFVEAPDPEPPDRRYRLAGLLLCLASAVLVVGGLVWLAWEWMR